MVNKIIDTTLDFADAEFQTFSLAENNELTLILKLWNDTFVSLVLTDVLKFNYSKGDIIKDIYENDESQLLNESLLDCFVKIPEHHSFKLYQLVDVQDYPFIEIVASAINVSRVDSR